ncbi:MAG: ATPase domain-containing protein [Methanolobus sp.]|nr:ATPase domain-containing protein [Methanolobus sp.]
MFKECLIGLDDLFKEDSDIPVGSVVLVTGAEGSLKSSILFNMISNYLAGSGEHALYATMDETEESHLRNMASLGFKKTDNMHVFDYRDMRHEWVNEEPDMVRITEEMINFYKDKYPDLKVLVFDALNALYSISSQTNLRKTMYHFFTMLRDKNLTSFLILETYSPEKHVLVGDCLERPEFFLADGVIELGIIEGREHVKRYIQIRKMRGAHHSMEKHQIVVQKDGIHVLGLVY